jgi:hypothetical protein
VSAPLALVLLAAPLLLAGRFVKAVSRQGELAQAGAASLLALIPALAAIWVAAAVSPGAPIY